MKKIYITQSVRLPKELHDQLTDEAERDERSVNWLLTKIVREYVGDGKRKQMPPAEQTALQLN